MSSRMRRTGFRFLRNKQYSARDLSECPAFFQDGLRRPTSIGVQPGKQIRLNCCMDYAKELSRNRKVGVVLVCRFRDMVFDAVMKVYGTMSGRRSSTDMRDLG